MLLLLDMHSLVNDGGSNHLLLLLRGKQKLISFMSLCREVAGIGQKGGKVDHSFINEHACNTASILLSKNLVNNAIDGISDKSLPILRVGNIV